MGRRIKVSLTLDERIVQAVDRVAAKQDRPNRSEVVERALKLWMQELKQLKLAQEIEEYYRSLTPEEIEEDAEWAGLGVESVGRSWDKQ